MNKKFVLFLCALLLATSLASALEMEFFYGQGCPHCAAAEAWLDKHSEEYNLSVVKREVYHNQSNALLMQERLAELGEQPAGVPTFIIENRTVLVGWNPRVRALVTGSPIPLENEADHQDKADRHFWLFFLIFLLLFLLSLFFYAILYLKRGRSR